MKNLLVIATIGISVLLFLVSLLLPAFYTPDEGIPGWFALLLGWLDLLAIDQAGFGVIGWFANLFLPIAWLGLALAKFRRVNIGGLILTIVGLGFALCPLFLNRILISEGGNTTPVTSLGIGFYVWLASFIVCVVGYIFIITTDAFNAKRSALFKMSLKLSTLWDVLQEVKDPEIPVVSLVEMGIVRDVRIEDEKAIITITPTFAGCPAMHVMKREVEERVRAMGIDVEVRTSLTPPWSSDWISDEARQKLKSFGLAPPLKHNGDINVILLEEASCPRCNSKNTTIKNTFGPTLCRAIFYCNECREAFEQFKAL